MDRPTGTLTFLFTDVEGSTRLLMALGDGYAAPHREHQRIVRDRDSPPTPGWRSRPRATSFFVVFGDAIDALTAAADIQRDLGTYAWPGGGAFRVRIGLHTGQAVVAGDDYVGLDVNRAARIANAANGGQTSSPTRSGPPRVVPAGGPRPARPRPPSAPRHRRRASLAGRGPRPGGRLRATSVARGPSDEFAGRADVVDRPRGRDGLPRGTYRGRAARHRDRTGWYRQEPPRRRRRAHAGRQGSPTACSTSTSRRTTSSVRCCLSSRW